MALGTLAVLGQLAGAGLNYFQGRQQKRDGETLAQEGREKLLGTAGPTDELLESVDEQKRLAQRAGDLGQERLDQSVTGLLDALSSGDPSAVYGMQGFGSNMARTSQDMGLKTATALSQANQPAVDAAEAAMDVSRGLAKYDMEQGTAAFNQGQLTMNEALGTAVNLPMDMASLQTASPDAYKNLFPNSGKEGIKTKRSQPNHNMDVIRKLIYGGIANMASGGLAYTGGGIKSSSFRDLIREHQNASQLEKEEVQDGEGGELEQQLEQQTTPHLERMKRIKETEEERLMSEEIVRLMRKSKGAFEMGGKVQDYMNGGDTLSQLLRPGQSFKSGGKEDHDVQEYDISDAKTGEVVAKTTGQEDHMVNEDGTITVMNSDQNESIHDAFKDVDVEMVLKALEKNPQKGNIRQLLTALNKVFSQKQFQS